MFVPEYSVLETHMIVHGILRISAFLSRYSFFFGLESCPSWLLESVVSRDVLKIFHSKICISSRIAIVHHLCFIRR